MTAICFAQPLVTQLGRRLCAAARAKLFFAEITIHGSEWFGELILRDQLLDNLVGATEQRKRDRQAKSLGGLHVYDQFDLCGPLHRQIGRLLALKDAAHVSTGQAIGIEAVSSVARGPPRSTNWRLGYIAGTPRRPPSFATAACSAANNGSSLVSSASIRFAGSRIANVLSISRGVLALKLPIVAPKYLPHSRLP